MNEYLSTPQGWECPKCQHIYSPSVAVCFNCPIKVITKTTSTDLPYDKECYLCKGSIIHYEHTKTFPV